MKGEFGRNLWEVGPMGRVMYLFFLDMPPIVLLKL